MNNILVVEDSLAQRQIFTNLLSANHKFTVTTAKDGIEALEQVFENHPDVVILDVIMPHINGYELCRRLKANQQTQNIPVILCSSQCSEVDRDQGLQQGADAYLGKPFQPQELLEIVQQFC